MPQRAFKAMRDKADTRERREPLLALVVLLHCKLMSRQHSLLPHRSALLKHVGYRSTERNPCIHIFCNIDCTAAIVA